MNKLVSFIKQRFVPVTHNSRVIVNDCDVVSSDAPLLNAIYGIDPVTGLPVGDLAIFLNEKANPEVRAYIQETLLKENSDISRADVSNEVYNKFRTELTDDDIQYFSRNHGESKEEFQDRIRLYLHHEKEKVATAKERKKLADALKKASEKV